MVVELSKAGGGPQLSSKAGTKTPMDQLEPIATSGPKGQPPEGKDVWYMLAKRRYAVQLYGIGKHAPDKASANRAILEFVQGKLKKPEIELRKAS